MKPTDIGLETSSLLLGKHSGRSALKDKLKQLNINVEEQEFEEIFVKFKAFCDYKKHVVDDDIIALASDRFIVYENGELSLVSYEISGSSDELKTGEVVLFDGKNKVKNSSKSKGPMNALFETINKIFNIYPALEEYNVSAVSDGIDSMAEAKTILNYDGYEFIGKGRDIDTIAASIKSYLHAMNKIATKKLEANKN